MFLGSPFFYILIIACVHFIFFRKKLTSLKKAIYFNLVFILFICTIFDFVFHRVSHNWNHYYRKSSILFHHGLKKNISTQAEYKQFTYPLKTNNLEMRDFEVRDVSLKKTGVKKRYLLIGDSFTEGVGVPYEKTFAGIITKTLKNEQIEVLNAGVISYSPKLYYLKTKALLDRGLEVDEVFVFIDMSDIMDEIVYDYFKPVDTFFAKTLDDMRLYFYQNSYIMFHIIERRRIAENPFSEFAPFWGGIEGYHRDRVAWTHNESLYKKYGKKGLSSAVKYMEKLYQLLKEHNINMHISIHPWPDQIYARSGENLHVATWKNFAKTHDIGFIDLYTPFFNETPPEQFIDHYYLKGDVHWNSKGHKLVAGKVLKYLRKNKK